MLYFILMFFSFLESIVGFALMSASVMRFREPVKKHITMALIVMILSTSLYFGALLAFGTDAVGNFAMVIILAAFSAWFLICSGDTIFVSLFNLLTFINIYVFTSYIGVGLAINWDGVKYLTVYIIIRICIYGGIIPFMFKFVRPHLRRLVDTLDKEWGVAALIPLIFLILQVFVLYYPVPYWKWGSSWNKYIIIVVYVLFLAVYYILYIQSDAIVEKYMMEGKALLMAQQNKLWEAELDRQKAAVSIASQQRHDMHHHNAVITAMLKEGNLAGLEDYMKSFDAALDVSQNTVYCKNPIINSICNAYSNKAEQAQIQIRFCMNVPEQTGIDNVDLTCIFGNVLENAIEGCMRLPEDSMREINAAAKYMDGRLRIQVENSCREDIVFEGELPKTQKQEGGKGIHSIIYTSERYDGTSGFSVNNGKFIAQIVLNAR